MDQPVSSQNSLRPGDRRRYPRQRPASIIYVELDSANGGIVRDLGVGGLALQAASKLTGKQDVALRLRLRESGQSIELVGGIAWLAPTQKEAGIYFKNLSSDAHQEISQWIAKQKSFHERATSIPPATSTRMVFSRGTPAMPHLTNQGTNTKRVVGFPAQVPATHPDAVFESERLQVPEPTRAPNISEIPRDDAENRKNQGIENVPKRQWVLPTSLFASRKGSAAEYSFSPAAIAAQTREYRHRRTIVLAGLLGCLLVLALILTFVHMVGSKGTGSSPQMPAIPVDSPSPDVSRAPIASAQTTVQPHSESRWTAFFKALFPNSDHDAKMDIGQEQANVPVWISKRSGYYYCSGSPDYAKAQPGAFMRQGEALQGGYQPRLGDLCH